MKEEFATRTVALIGRENAEKLYAARVLVCGLGGVGGYVAEALARVGIGTLGVLDCDVISPSNINRQILATTDTLGMKKTEVARRRILSINPDCNVRIYDLMYLPDILPITSRGKPFRGFLSTRNHCSKPATGRSSSEGWKVCFLFSLTKWNAVPFLTVFSLTD